ncbi:MAG: alkaline phosphatase family protein [Deltaproteobacteria bacterium]|nr:alkaline phosphatase family protein [Deltaproteobacteria bacterium]
MKYACLLAALLACSGSPATHARGPEAPDRSTRLVVLLVLDQWPEWSFEQKRAAFRAGFARMLSEGEWFVGEHPSAATLTAPGHALLGTGAATATSGIVANEWWHRDLHEVLASVESENGTDTTKWLRVPGLGDALAKTRGKAVGMSLKARAALLPLGHTGLAFYYDSAGRRFNAHQLANSTPAAITRPWLETFTAAHPLALTIWTPLPESAQLAGVADDRPGEVGESGFGPTFPHDPNAAKDPGHAVFAMPLGNDALLDVAEAALTGENLGTDDAPDLLVISLSAHDLVGHGWGHESIEQWDMELRLDQRLAAFMDVLDQKVGASHWAMIVTSDHGAAPLPESIHGGRLTHDQVRAAANQAAIAVLGPGTWVDNAHYPNIYFSDAFKAQPANERKSAIQRVEAALRSFPSIEQVGAVADIAGHCDTRPPKDQPLCRTFDLERSGDLYYLPARGYIMDTDDEPTATAHGSLQDYDREVPLIVLGPRRTKHEPPTAPTEKRDMREVAPLLASWLGVKL